MPELVAIVLLTAGAGACVPLGGALASIERIRPAWLESELRHFVIALGGGILLGAVAVVLVPEGVAAFGGSAWPVPLVVAGGATFMLVERELERRGRGSPQLLGTLLDYVPEALALGGLAASGSAVAPLLAALIGLQNLPEGFNGYRELAAHMRAGPARILGFMAGLAALGPAAAVAGYAVLSEPPWVLGAVMLVASGGILYLVFEDIAPQARLEKHWAPPLGAVVGFCIALAGELWLAP